MRRIFIIFPLALSLILGIFIIYFNFKNLNIFKKDQENKITFLEQQLDKNYRRNFPVHLPILLYHYIENVTDERDTIRKSLNVNPLIFDSQIRLLLEKGFTIITLKELINYYNGQSSLPDKPIILSFDDGYRDFYTDVFPILQKYHVPAVLYVTSGFVDLTHNYLTMSQLKTLAKSNLVEIGAHGVNHLNLNYSDPVSINSEIFQSKANLEQFIGKPVEHFAYPMGEYNQNVINLIKKAGYLSGATTDMGVTQSYGQIFELKRIRPGSSQEEYFLSLLK